MTARFHQWGKRVASLKYIHPETGAAFRFGALNDEGNLAVTHMIPDRYLKLGLPEKIWKTYMTELAQLIPGARHAQSFSASNREWDSINMEHDEDPPLRLLAPKRREWMDLIDRTIAEINKAMDVREVASVK